MLHCRLHDPRPSASRRPQAAPQLSASLSGSWISRPGRAAKMTSRMGIGVAGRATKFSFCWFPAGDLARVGRPGTWIGSVAHDEAAVDIERLAGHVVRIAAGEKTHHTSYVLGRFGPAERNE